MLAEERFALILNLLAEKRTATVQELCEALNASESTNPPRPDRAGAAGPFE